MYLFYNKQNLKIIPPELERRSCIFYQACLKLKLRKGHRRAYGSLFELKQSAMLVVSTHLKNMRKSNWIMKPHVIRGENSQNALVATTYIV